MDKIVTENLFLLEFLVDKIRLDPYVIPDPGDYNTCVSVQFLDNPPLDICDNDFPTKPQEKCTLSRRTATGKSCLFSLTRRQAEDAMEQFDVRIKVFKKLTTCNGPEKIQVGRSIVSVVDLFAELIDAVNRNPDNCGPTDKTLNDTFEIFGQSEETIGDLSMYIRMSCFGKLIVTQFQMNMADKSILFKDRQGRSLYRYKRSGKTNEIKSIACSKPCHPQTPRFPAGQSYGDLSCDCYPDESCYFCPPPSPNPCCYCPPSPSETYHQSCVSNVTSQSECQCISQSLSECRCVSECPGLSQCPEVPPCFPPVDLCACYEEIGATMGGNTVTVRVHKDNTIEKVNECTCSCPQDNRVAAGASCTCNETPFQVKVAGCAMPTSNDVTVIPPVYNTSDEGGKVTELSDPNRDVYILRISKRGGSKSKKNNLELELCTPRGPDLRPPPDCLSRDTEWCKDDAVAAGMTCPCDSVGTGEDSKR